MHIDDIAEVNELKDQFNSVHMIRNQMALIANGTQQAYKPAIFVGDHGCSLVHSTGAASRLVQLLDVEMRTIIDKLRALGVETDARETETQR